MLLFLVQPILAKAVLPWFGGSAGVWTACMMFFQVVLLAGYGYAHAIRRYLPARLQAPLHALLLAGSLCLLPVSPRIAWPPETGANPITGILMLLAVCAGLPYFLLSTTGPLVQSWYAGAKVAFPYRLFAVSNLGSLLALLAYPAAIEPFLNTGRQLWWWSAGYAVFVLLAGAATLSSHAAMPPRASPVRLGERALWVTLAALPSALWLAVANHLSQNVAPVPFLWILPLSLYLLSFILCFDRQGWYSPRLFRWILPTAWVAMCAGFLQPASSAGLKWSLVLFLTGLEACCVFCHGELARRKPAANELTSFYLMVALGGAAGGAFVAVAAPTLFNSYLELPLSIAGCVILAMGLLYQCSPRSLARMGVTTGVASLAALEFGAWANGNRFQQRNFYGVVQVADSGAAGARIRVLSNGAIQHGIEFQDAGRALEPTAYYGPNSGAALALRRQGMPQRVGVIGLGTGTLALYGRPGDVYRFYELNPLVIQVAASEFSFLRLSRARVEVVPGDARLSLEAEPPQGFDVLALDAFTGDAIPMHLLTREAFRLYFRHLKPDGVLAVHITNRYLDLAPVVQALARDGGKDAMLIRNLADQSHYVYDSSWVLVSANEPFLERLRWASVAIPPRPRLRPWTDDYSNLLQVLR
ncbi:MAG TPA: fused MFS/spermidine synthase [Bryobacteraceae bacterium]|nr:fused MFS/spermidine synthase [Bryobacteraceae bacterium]